MDIVCYAVNPGWPLNLGIHRFTPTPDKQLAHYIDGDLRAVVPPEGFDSYAESWPQCAPVIRSLRREPKRPEEATAAASELPGGPDL